MQQLLYGIAFLVCGLGLILLNKSIAELNQSVNKLFGMGAVHLRWYRIGNIIAGVFLSVIGILFIFNIAKLT